MLTNNFLYGDAEPPAIPRDVCQGRIDLLNIRLKDILSVGYMEQDNQALNAVMRAISFWTKMRDGEEEY